MTKPLTPVTILTLLKKAKKAYQKVVPDTKDEAEQRHRKINEDLNVLRRFARQEEKGTDLDDVFEARKLRCFKKLKVQYQKLKGARDKDPNKARLPKYLVALGKLSLSVKRLKYSALSDEEEANLEPDALEAESEEDLRQLEVAEPEEEAPKGPPVAGAAALAAALLRRLNALTVGVNAAVKAKAPDGPRMQALSRDVGERLEAQEYTQARKALDELEGLVRAAAVPASPGDSPLNGAVAFNTRLKALLPLVLAVQKANPAGAAELSLGINEAKALAGKQEFIQANSRLDAVEKLLRGPRAAAAPSGDEVIQRFNKLAGDLKAHLAVDGPDRPQIQALAVAVKGLLSSKDYARASGTLDELEPLLKKKPPEAPKLDQALVNRCQALRLALELDFHSDKSLRPKLLPLFESAMGLVMKGHPGAEKAVNKFEDTVADVKKAAGAATSLVYKEFERYRSAISQALAKLTTDPPAPVIVAMEMRFVQAVGLADRKDDAKTQEALDALKAVHAELANPKPEVHAARVQILLARLEKKLKGDDVGLLGRDVQMDFRRQFEELAAAKALDPNQRAQALGKLDTALTKALTDRMVELTGFIADLERAEPHLERATAYCNQTAWDDVKAKLRQGRQDLDNGFGGPAVPLAERQRRLGELYTLINQTLGRYEAEVARPKYGAQADQWRELELRATLPVPANDMKRGQELGRGAFGAAYRLAGVGGAGTSLVGKTSSQPGETDLRQEEQIYAKLGEHPNITKCYGVQQIDGQNMLVMKEVKGGDLNKVCDDLEKKFRDKKISREEYLGGIQHLIKGTLKGLAHFRSVGLVHRDIKGDNIRYDDETGEAVLIDMGLATPDGQALPDGTPMFLPTVPPEVLDSRVPTNFWDSFALGKMLFPLLEQLPDSPLKFQFIAGLREAQPATLDHGSYQAPGVDLVGNLSKTLARDATTGTLTALPDAQGNLAGQPLKPAAGDGPVNPGEYGALTSYVAFMNKLTHPDPKQRLKPADALKHPFMVQALADGVDPKKLFAREPKDPAAAAPPGAPPEAPPGGDDATVFNTRLKNLGPRILKALGATPALADRLKAAVSKASEFAKQKNFVQASKWLNDVENTLAAPAPGKQAVEDRHKKLEAQIDAHPAVDGPDRPRIQALAASAELQLEKGDHVQASKVLDELEPLLQKPVATPPGGATASAAELKEMRAALQRLEAALDADPPLKAKLLRLLKLAQERVAKGDPGAKNALKSLEEMRQRVQESGGLAAPAVYTQFEQLRNDVSKELDQVMASLPRDQSQALHEQFTQAAAKADPKDEGKTRAAIKALEQVQAGLHAKTPELAGARTQALLTRLAKVLKGTDGGLLAEAVREGFLKRFRALEAGEALPPDRRLQDAAALDGEVKAAVAARVKAVDALMRDVAQLKPLFEQATALCQQAAQTGLKAALEKKYAALTDREPASFANLSLESRRDRLAEFQGQLTRAISQGKAGADTEAVLQRFNRLAGKIGHYLAVGGPAQARVQELTDSVNRRVARRDFALAWQALDELEPLLDTAAAAGAPPPNFAAVVAAHYNRLIPRVQQAKQTNPTLAGELDRRLTVARENYDRGDFVAAAARLNALEQVLALAAKAAPVEQEVRQRFADLDADIRAARAAHAPALAGIEALANHAATLLGNGKVAEASKALDELESLLVTPPAPAPASLDDLKAWLAGLEPRIKQVQKDDPDLGNELDRRVWEAVAIIKKGELVPAAGLLHAVEKLLAVAAAVSPAAAPAPLAAPVPEPDPLRGDDLIQDYPEGEEELEPDDLRGGPAEESPYGWKTTTTASVTDD